MKDVKDYVKSFGRIPVAPPGSRFKSKKDYQRFRPEDRKRLLEEALEELEDLQEDYYENCAY